MTRPSIPADMVALAEARKAPGRLPDGAAPRARDVTCEVCCGSGRVAPLVQCRSCLGGGWRLTPEDRHRWITRRMRMRREGK